MRDYLLEKMSYLFQTGIFKVTQDGVRSYSETEKLNPLYLSADIRSEIIEAADRQELPYLAKDDMNIYFGCIRGDEAHFLIGPMATERLTRVQRHAFYNKNDIKQDLDKQLPTFTLMEMLQLMCALANIITGSRYGDHDLVLANNLMTEDERETDVELLKYSLQEDEADLYRHTYQDERRLLDAVREGKPEEAVRLAKDMDINVGKLSEKDTEHWRNLLIIGVTLCARAAIEAGLQPYIAYRISGFYINKGSECTNALQILAYRNEAVEELARRVNEIKGRSYSSNYVERCKDYVRKHFKEKIYLEDIAEKLGISTGYLSRLFKKETGQNLQDYIVDFRVERAVNLLVYSDESIPDIAEYVNFPSQSYFGRVFKERKGMTPKQYRDKNKPTEFV